MNFKFLPDIPIDSRYNDFLGYSDFIEILKSSIYQTETPFVYGVLGNWGSGKTSILQLLKDLLEKDLENGVSKAVPIWFNAWEYENEANIIYPLFDSIRQHYIAKNPINNLSKEFNRHFLDIVTACTFTLGDVGLRIATKALTGESVKLEDVEKHIETIKANSSQIDKILSNWTNEVHVLKNGFEKLLETYANEYPFNNNSSIDARFIILIDDLDRCLPETVIGLLEKIKNILSVKKCIFVLALNPRIVYQGIRIKYHGLDINGREYLEKIINYSFYVPEPDSEHIETYCRKSFENLVEDQDRQGYSGYFDRFGQILCNCHFSNPRKIKRILNHYLFFIKLNEKNIEQYHLPNIIRLIILAEYYPSLFEIFLSDNKSIESILQEMKKLGTNSFNVKEFGDKFGVPIADVIAELIQMKSLFELIPLENRDQKNIPEHAQAVFRIVRLS